MGTILTAEQAESIPVSEGLHHHGDEPTQAGYTLDEILHLLHSTVVGQVGLIDELFFFFIH
jgi:hypothetical protein